MAKAKASGPRRKAVGLIVTGIPEIDRKMKELPKRVGAKVVRQELDKEARVMAKRVKAGAPEFIGTLRRQVKPTRAKSGKRGSIRNQVLINWRGITYFEDGFYPAFVEYGTKNGVRAQRYMDKAYRGRGPASAASLEKGIAAGLDKEVKKLGGEK